MYPGDEQEGLSARCPVFARLTDPQVAVLTALPVVVDPILQTVTCELVAGHEGDHLAFTVAPVEDGRWWWLSWAARRSALIQAHTCARTSNKGPHRDECMLADDHPGPHSFDIRATAGAPEQSDVGYQEMNYR